MNILLKFLVCFHYFPILSIIVCVLEIHFTNKDGCILFSFSENDVLNESFTIDTVYKWYIILTEIAAFPYAAIFLFFFNKIKA